MTAGTLGQIVRRTVSGPKNKIHSLNSRNRSALGFQQRRDFQESFETMLPKVINAVEFHFPPVSNNLFAGRGDNREMRMTCVWEYTASVFVGKCGVRISDKQGFHDDRGSGSPAGLPPPRIGTPLRPPRRSAHCATRDA